MRPLQITLFLIAFVALTTQTFRHAYVRWLEPRTSVLDKFSEQVEQDISAAKNLEELLTPYEEAHRKVKEAEKDLPNNPDERSARFEHEPFKSESKLKSAILTWEQHSKEIYQLRFYWTCGFVCILAGIICYQYFNPWIGMGGIIVGFSEMIYWTCPSFNVFGSQVEFDRLLMQKVILSVLSWILLVSIWCLSNCRVARKL